MTASPPRGHRVLLADDDPGVLAYLDGLIRARGDSPRLASTVEEALAAIEEEDFCYAIVDQQLPARTGEQAFVSGGETVMAAFRKKDDRRNADGRHVTPLLVVTGYLVESGADRDRIAEFFAKMFDLGADAVVEKPLDARNTDRFLEKLRTALGKAGREDHGACGALGGDAAGRAEAQAQAEAPRAGAVRIEIDGWKQGRNTGFLVNGQRCILQDARFVVFLRLVVAHVQCSGAWVPSADLAAEQSNDRASRIRKAFRGLIDDGVQIIESDRDGRLRLHPSIVIERVDWRMLEGHAEIAVQKLVKESRHLL